MKKLAKNRNNNSTRCKKIYCENIEVISCQMKTLAPFRIKINEFCLVIYGVERQHSVS